ncbi:hypothetical protein JOQ06_012510 [Pogonophryne albipinna]|uniref:Ig-like domain-containing protein n=1 Tax=Pogonophryne albipinna TaxID=1090488 RepID=A0AAD6F463_9TELE|nr:hypothetical protein JOQ06_012510 [Pogonophryne albipinna]
MYLTRAETLLFSALFPPLPHDTEVKEKPGKNVTLHCNTDAAIALAERNRSGRENYVVFFCRDNRLIGTFPFHGLVELKGDGSVVLKNVSVNDTGNYTCLVWTLSDTEEKCVASVHLSVSGVTELKAKPGEDVTLPCNCTKDAAIALVLWNRTDLVDDVFFFRDNKLIRIFQNLSFRGRVELKDPEMTNGDCSVVLKNVSVNDTGNYTCRVRTLSDTEEKCVASVHLSVSGGSGNETKAGNLKNGQINDENEWGYLTLVCLCVFVLLVLVFFFVLVLVVLVHVLVTIRHVVEYIRAMVRTLEEGVDELEIARTERLTCPRPLYS